jgi:Ser/Thr protein kinase RdoA (MazF antagonist)
VGFERFIWNWEGLLGGRGFGYSVEELIASMPKHLQEPFQTVSKEVRATMKSLGKGSDAYGMIHADMYPDNILFKDGGVFPIDFEDCGFGYWLWDIGVALEQQPWTDTWHKKRDAFLEGYIQTHALPDSQLRYIHLFMAANYATGVLWASAFILDDPARKDEHENWRTESGAKLLQYFKRR